MDASGNTKKTPEAHLLHHTDPTLDYFPSTKTTAGRTRLWKIVENILRTTARVGNPEKGYAIRQMYQQSSSNPRLADLMDVVLSKKATPEQFAEFQAYAKDLEQANKKVSVPEVVVASSEEQQQQQQPQPQQQQQVQSGGLIDAMDDGGSSTDGGNTRDEVVVVAVEQQGAKRLWEEVLTTTDEDTDHETRSATNRHQKKTAPQKSAAIRKSPSNAGAPQQHQPMSESNAGSEMSRRVSALRISPTSTRYQEIRTKELRGRFLTTKVAPSQLIGSSSDAAINSSFGGIRGSKRQKTVNVKKGATEQPPERDEEGVGEEEDLNLRTALSEEPAVAPQSRPDISRIIEGCLKKSAATGYATVGHAIKKYCDESLSDPLKKKILDDILDRIAIPEQILSFQRYIGEYYREHKKAYSGGAKPVATASNSPPPTEPSNREDSVGLPISASGNIIVVEQQHMETQREVIVISSSPPRAESTPRYDSPQTPPDPRAQNIENLTAVDGTRLPSPLPSTAAMVGPELGKSLPPSPLGFFGSPDAAQISSPTAAVGFGFGNGSLSTSLVTGLSIDRGVSLPPSFNNPPGAPPLPPSTAGSS